MFHPILKKTHKTKQKSQFPNILLESPLGILFTSLNNKEIDENEATL